MIAPLLLGALVVAAADDVVARVDGVAVARAELVRRMDAAGSGRPLSAEVAIEQVVNDVLLAGEARRLGLASAPEVTARAQAQLRAAAASALIEDVGSRAEIPDATLREMFHGQTDLASCDALYFESRDAAAASLERLRKGGDVAKEAPLAVVARVHPKPADAPPLMRAEMDPALAAALFAAAPGQLVGPVETRNGFAVARLHRKEVGSAEQFKARRPALARHARKKLMAEARRHLGEQLRAKSGVTIDEPFLRGLDGLQATPQQLDHVVATVAGAPVRYRDVYPSLRALGGGHMAGPGVKVAFAWEVVEARLIEQAAVERGLLSSPAVEARRPEIERAALAAAAVARIQASVPAPTEDEIEAYHGRNRRTLGKDLAKALPAAAAGAAAEKRSAAVNRRLGELRAKASISIDREAVARAARAEP